MQKKKHLYSYIGAVTSFNYLLTRRWSAATHAVSFTQAKNNLKYQFKKENNMIPNARIELCGNLIKI